LISSEWDAPASAAHVSKGIFKWQRALSIPTIVTSHLGRFFCNFHIRNAWFIERWEVHAD
jgi:hypothetical protein